MSANLTADQFVEKLKTFQSPEEKEKIQRTLKPGEGVEFIGVRMGQVFALAKEYMDMPMEEVENLLENPIHEARVGAVSIMDFQARSKKTGEDRRQALYDLYIRRHERINNWDMVDRATPYVVGGYLYDKPRDILYQLARSESQWERRTAIVSTYFFIRQGDLDDTFKIAEILVNDPEDLVQKAVGGWLREAGKRDPQKLVRFLDQ
jgi:3-methyladenine DNA glycosylase AlkD